MVDTKDTASSPLLPLVEREALAARAALATLTPAAVERG